MASRVKRIPIITSERNFYILPTMIRREKHGSHGITGCGHNYAGIKSASNKGICTDLGNNVFHYGHKAEADQMRTP